MPGTSSSVISGLKQILPDTSWNWVIPSMMKEPLVWDSLCSQDGKNPEGTYEKIIHRPEDCTPAALALSLLNYPATPDQLRSLPLIPIEDGFRESVEAILPEEITSLPKAGLFALQLREQYRKTGAWDDGLNKAPAAALCCLFGIIPDQLALLKTLINPLTNKSDDAENQSIEVALHVLLSNPLPLDAVTELVILLVKELPRPLQYRMIIKLAGQHAQLGARLAQYYINNYPSNSHNKPSSLLGYVKEIKHKVEYAEISRLAADTSQGSSLLDQVKNEISQFHAQLNAEIAKNAVISGDAEKAINAIEKAIEFDTSSPDYFATLLMALIDHNDYNEALRRLNDYSTSHAVIDHPGILLANALIENNSQQDDPFDRMMKARDIGLKIIYFLRDAPSSSPVTLKDPTFVIRLTNFLLSVNLAQEAVWVLDNYALEQADNPSLYHLLALSKYATADYENAIQAAHLAVAGSPFENQFCQTLAECLEAGGDWQNALIERKRLMERLNPPTLADYHALAACALHAGSPETGIKACQQALLLNENDGIAYAIWGELMTGNGDVDEAIGYLNRAIQLTPNEIYPWKALAEFHLRAGDAEKALETIKAATHIAPDLPEIYLLLGETYLKSDSPTLALEAFRQAANTIDGSVKHISPKEDGFIESIKAINLVCLVSEKLGEMLCQLGHLDDSQSILEKTFGIYPFNSNLAYQLARTYMAQEEYAAALSAIETVLTNNPRDAQPYLDYARCALALQENGYRSILYDISLKNNSDDQNNQDHLNPAKNGKLISILHTALQIDPSLAEAKALLAEVLAVGGDYSMAMDAYRAALETDLAKDETWQSRIDFGLGLVALKLHQGETAVAALLEANKTDPTNPLIHEALSEAYKSLGLNEDAFNSARAALMIAPGNIDHLSWFAGQVLSLKDHQGEILPQARSEAIAALRRAIGLAPQRADLLIFLGKIQYETGDRNGAKESFSKLVPNQNQEYSLDSLPSELYLASKYLSDLDLPLGACACLEKALENHTFPSDSAKARVVSANPSPLEIYSLLAKSRRQSGAFQSALDALNQAILLAPDGFDLYLDKVDLILEMNPGPLSRDEKDESISTIIQCLDIALKLSPENPDIYLRYALVLRMIGKLSLAQTYAEKAAELYARKQPESVIPVQGDIVHFRADGINARLLAAELARVLLAPKRALGILEPTMQIGSLPGNPRRKDAANVMTGSFPLDYSCLHAELVLDADDNVSATNDLANIPEAAQSRPRALVLQARLAIRSGEAEAAANMLRNALEEIGSIQSSTAPQWMQISSLDNIAAAFNKIALYRAVAETALELHQWETALYLLREAAFVATHEPQSHLELARAIVIRAEYQNLCQETEVVSRSPGIAALSDVTHRSFLDAIQSAQKLLEKEVKDSGNFENVDRWKTRGNAIFEADLQITQTFSQLHAKPDDIAAQIAALRQLNHISEAGQIGRSHAHHPLVLIQLALTLQNENPRQALAAAYSAHEASHKSLGNTKLGQPVNQSPQILAIGPIIDYLLAHLAFNVGNRNGDFTTAIKAIEEALSQWADEPHWHLLAANILQAAKNSDGSHSYQNALSHLIKAAELEPQNGNTYLAIGNIYMKENNIPLAIKSFDQACRLLPDQADAWLLLAQCYDVTGNLSEAKRCVDQAISLDPTQPPSLLLRAQIALKNRDYIAAERLANTVLQFEPENTTAMLLQTQVLSALNKPDEGLAILEKALSGAHDNASLRLERIRLLRRTNKFDMALTELKELTQRYPDDPAILMVFAEVLEEIGEKNEAIKIAQRALRTGHERSKSASFDEHARLHILLGQLFHQTGQLDQAIQHLSEAIQIEPNIMEPYLELAQTYKERRDNGQALTLFQQAIKTAPEDHRPYYQAGLLLKDTKDYIGAEKMLRKAAKLAPKELPIQRQLGALVALNLVHNRSTAHPA